MLGDGSGVAVHFWRLGWNGCICMRYLFLFAWGGDLWFLRRCISFSEITEMEIRFNAAPFSVAMSPSSKVFLPVLWRLQYLLIVILHAKFCIK